jgi:hypothetical protein
MRKPPLLRSANEEGKTYAQPYLSLSLGSQTHPKENSMEDWRKGNGMGGRKVK